MHARYPVNNCFVIPSTTVNSNSRHSCRRMKKIMNCDVAIEHFLRWTSRPSMQHQICLYINNSKFQIYLKKKLNQRIIHDGMKISIPWYSVWKFAFYCYKWRSSTDSLTKHNCYNLVKRGYCSEGKLFLKIYYNLL